MSGNSPQEPETVEPTPSIPPLEAEQEEERLKGLHEYGILDTPSEQEFDQVARLAAEACETPIALITFMDRDRQWIKARVGFHEQETKREDSFCQYSIHVGDRIMEVPDALKNPLFCNKPLVKKDPGVRFYAGAPLIDRNGYALGSLCIMDEKPREVGRKEKFILKSLAEQVVKELEVRLAFKDLYEKHRDLYESVNYARRIQNAIFQPVREVTDRVPPHFVFLRPYGQVSGDFYWAREHRGHLFIAAVDCTGHGIPGAFLSMLGIAFLNDILNEEEETPLPGELLNRLKIRVLRELKGGQTEGGLSDGMDASLLRIPLDPKKDHRTVHFAGAHNSLYVIREGIGEETPEKLRGRPRAIRERISPFKNSPNGIMVKGDPQPIGHFDHASESFSSVPLKLRTGDTLYLFSDGFPDQFGGNRNRKFRYGPFRALLERIHKLPMDEQKKGLERTLEDWTQGAEHSQTDDILVIGLRL